MDKNKIKNISLGALFDLDGVLIDSETEYTRLWSEINHAFPTGVPGFERKIKGTTLDDILGTYYPDPVIQREVYDELHRKEAKMHYPYCKGAEELLCELRHRGIPVAMVTSSNNKKMAHLWQLQPGLRDAVDVIISGDQVEKSKPDPEGYLKGAALINRDPRHCVVFEDSLQGIRAGRAAGAYVVGLSGTLGREALEGECDILIDSLTELDLDILIQNIKKHAITFS